MLGLRGEQLDEVAEALGEPAGRVVGDEQRDGHGQGVAMISAVIASTPSAVATKGWGAAWSSTPG
jgi:hypothetical protein